MHNVIHIEGSSLGRDSYPIEVGVALADGRRKCTLICPPNEWMAWDGQIDRAPSLTRENLLVNGRSVLNVALLLNEWLGDEVVYSNNWGNEACWLNELYRTAGLRQRFSVDSVNTLLGGNYSASIAYGLPTGYLGVGARQHAKRSGDARWRASTQAAQTQRLIDELTAQPELGQAIL